MAKSFFEAAKRILLVEQPVESRATTVPMPMIQESETIDPAAETSIAGLSDADAAVRDAYNNINPDLTEMVSKLRGIVTSLDPLAPIESKRQTVASMLNLKVIDATASELKASLEAVISKLCAAAAEIDDGCKAKSRRLSEEIEEHKRAIETAQREIAETEGFQASSKGAFDKEIQDLEKTMEHLTIQESENSVV